MLNVSSRAGSLNLRNVTVSRYLVGGRLEGRGLDKYINTGCLISHNIIVLAANRGSNQQPEKSKPHKHNMARAVFDDRLGHPSLKSTSVYGGRNHTV